MYAKSTASNEHKEGHGVVSEVERRWFLKHLGEEKWLHYGVLYDETIEKNGTTSREPLN